jgi:SWI/SNF-related matrix-associated actin-dependent regulator 1 of chromatin subfamily A
VLLQQRRHQQRQAAQARRQPTSPHAPLPAPALQVTVLPCRHFFHPECITTWLQRNSTCPLCKADVLEAFEAAKGPAPASGRRRGWRSGLPGRRQRRPVAPAAAVLPGESQQGVTGTPSGAAGSGEAQGAPGSWVPAAAAAGGDASSSAGGVSSEAAAAITVEAPTMPVPEQDFSAAAAALAALAAEAEAAAAAAAAAAGGASSSGAPAPAGQAGSRVLASLSSRMRAFWRESGRGAAAPAAQPAAAAGAWEPAAEAGVVELQSPPLPQPPRQPQQPAAVAPLGAPSFRTRGPVVVYAYADNLGGASEGGAAAGQPPEAGGAPAGLAGGPEVQPPATQHEVALVRLPSSAHPSAT